MFADVARVVLLLLAAVVPADEQPEVSLEPQQYLLVLRRFEVPKMSAGRLVAGSAGREAAPKLRPFRSLPSGRELDVISEHVSVVAAEQPQYAVLRRNVLRDWIVEVQDESERNGGAGVCLLAPKIVTSEGRTAEFSIQGDPAVQFQSRISGRADGTMQADVLIVRDTGKEGGDSRRLQLEFSVELSEEQPHMAVVLECPQSASSAGTFRRIRTASAGKTDAARSEVWTVTCERFQPGSGSAFQDSTFDRPDQQR